MKAIFLTKRTWLALAMIAGLAGVSWWQRSSVVAWYHVRQLSHAGQDDCAGCAEKVAALEESALPAVLGGLQSNDSNVCANMHHALLLMIKRWGAADVRTQQVTERLHVQFGGFSRAGQERIVVLLTGLLQQDGPKPVPPRLTKAVSEILLAAEKSNELRGVSLRLAAELVECVQPGQWVDVCRGMAERGMKDDHAGTRVAALQLLLREPMRNSKELLEKATPLLLDTDAAVRRAAILSLASEVEVAREEHFMPLLHDDDAEVQYLSELALRKRGLQDDDIKMARMISHKKASVRMLVLHYFRHMPELNLASWLRQLSNDPEPAVRAAAVRAAADFPHVDFAQRLREMAERDPSEAVRLNASFYLQQRSARAALD